MAYTGFDKLKGELARKPGITDPGALAAVIGRRKYGAKQFQHAAATGHSLKNAKHKAPAHRRKQIEAFMKRHQG